MTDQRSYLIPILTLAITLAGCGAEAAPCAAQLHETHLTEVPSEPSGLRTMLHHADQACASVGQNRFHVYLVPDDGTDDSAALHDHSPAATRSGHQQKNSGAVAITRVSAIMPAHGHGPASGPDIDPADGSIFTLGLQMPGTWELTVEFAPQLVTSEAQTALFLIDVRG